MSRPHLDLHLHTTRSDGKYDPDVVIRRCAAARLDVIALTDHDLTQELEVGERTIDGHRLRLIGAAEISGMHEGREQHLLVYFPGEVPTSFRAFCREQCQERARRYAAAVERLGLEDLELPDQEAVEGHRSVTRMHLARDLVAKGHVIGVRDAFARMLSDRHGLVPPLSLSFEEAIRVARAAGGLTSWAHPPLPLVEAWVAGFAAAGLQGLEAFRPMVSSDERRRYRRLAQRHGLWLTGGSDWHGWGDDGDLGLFRVEARDVGDFLDALHAA
ncbi:MAG: hypothetical protein H6734_28275 [Alphaproteobacteria bacterium]|nr:hypothetical protein [Alphaproteobacteria bacterium]